MKGHGKRKIAPRLADGSSRLSLGNGVPEVLKEGLTAIARREGRSRSWVVEEALLDYFGIRAPKFMEPKKTKKKR